MFYIVCYANGAKKNNEIIKNLVCAYFANIIIVVEERRIRTHKTKALKTIALSQKYVWENGTFSKDGKFKLSKIIKLSKKSSKSNNSVVVSILNRYKNFQFTSISLLILTYFNI